MFTFYWHGLNIHPLDGSSVPSCSIFQKHRNFEPSHGAFCSLCRGVVKQKPLSYSIVHGFNFQLSDLNLWQLWEWMFFNTKPTETNPPAGMVCLVLPGLLFFYTCRMQCRAKVGGLQQSLLSKGRGVCQLCPGLKGWVGVGRVGWNDCLLLTGDGTHVSSLLFKNACCLVWSLWGNFRKPRHLSISLWKKGPYVYERSEPQKNCSWEAVSGDILHRGCICQDQPSNGKQLHLDKCCCLRSWQAFWSLCLVWSSLWWVQNLGRMNSERIGGFWSSPIFQREMSHEIFACAKWDFLFALLRPLSYCTTGTDSVTCGKVLLQFLGN